MANYANLLAQITANIYSNNNQDITGDGLQAQLNAMVASLGAGYQFMGVAHPADTPSGYADLRAFWLAGEAGTYTNFGGLVLADGEVAVIKYDGNGWSKSVTGAASAAQVDELVQEVTDIPFPRESTYINTSGEPGASAAGYNCTNLIKVNPRETWVYSGYFAAPSLHMVWGYPTKSYSNGQGILVAGVSYEKTEFVVPEGINYLMAWGPISTVELYKKGNLQDLRTDLANFGEELDELRFDTIGIADNYDASALTSINYYSLNDGTQQGQSNNYRTAEFDIPSWATKIVASFPAANAAFGVLLYGAGGTFIRSYAAATSMKIALAGLGATKAIIQNYQAWSATTFSFASKDHIADLEEDVEEVKGKVSAEFVTIVATRNAANYNSIRDIVAGINDATPSHKYIVFIPAGRWFECDLQGKENVILVGEDRENTILYCDGTSNKLTPEDYSYGGATCGVALSSLPQSQKHCVYALKDIEMKNLTIEVNDAKYCAHLDYVGWSSAKFENCHFIANANVNYPIGIGIRGGQECRFKGCILDRISPGQNGFFAHNWNNQSSPSLVSFSDCYFKKCGFATIDELGSEQEDAWELLNCYSDRGGQITWMVDFDSQGNTYWINPETGQREADPTKVPYCIKLNCLGSNVGVLVRQPFHNTSVVARPNCAKYIVAENLSAQPESSHPVGKVVRGYYSGVSLIEGATYPFIGVIDSVIDGISYLADKIVCLLYANINGSSFSIGSLVYVGADGYLTTSQTGSAVGVISGDYYGIGWVITFFD